MENRGRKLAMLCLHGGKPTQHQCSVSQGLNIEAETGYRQSCACAALEKQGTMGLPHHEGRHDVDDEHAQMILQAHMWSANICACKCTWW